MNLNDLIIRRPSQFHRVEDKRDRIIFECDPKDGWCQFAIGQSELGQKAELTKADVRKVVQTLMPYLQKAKGIKWKPQGWLAHKGYRLEFAGASANVRLFSCQTFIVRGGLLMWAGMNCPEAQRARWQPVYEEWLKTAHLKKE